MNRIRSISYLDNNGKRQRLYVDERTGYFNFPLDNQNDRRAKYQMYGLSAVLLVDAVRRYDPVLELENRDRVRVCQGGDGTSVRVEAICICESHDKYYRNKKNKGIRS